MIIDEKIFDGYDNAKLNRYDDQTCNFPTTCAFDEVPRFSVSGVLKANRYVNGKLMQTFSQQENHVGIIAATRQGKTTSGIIPMVIANARKKNKCNMVLSDPKGEVYYRTASTLREEGYRVILINLRDYRHSECWNPLTPIYRKFHKAKSLADEVEIVSEKNVKQYRFMGKNYTQKDLLDQVIARETASALDDVYHDIDLLGTMMITIEDKNDPIWEMGSRNIFKAFLHAMLEDSISEDNPITEETFSLNTIFTIFSSFIGDNNPYDGGYFSYRPHTSKAYELAKSQLLISAERTRDSYMTTFSQKISELMDVAIRRITSCNSFEVSELGQGPTALFLCYRDELQAHYQLISLFVQDAYKTLIDMADQNDVQRLDTPFYFILDEFGNFPRLQNFQSVISACAGRNIWFVLVLQSYAQLNAVYGPDTTKIILDNLNVQIFFGSNNWNTITEFSDSCGKYTILSPESALNGDSEEMNHFRLDTVPLVTRSMLCRLKPGECIVKEANDDVMFSRMERYFLCEEYRNLPIAREKEYVCSVDPLDPKYIYIPKERTNPRKNRVVFNF